MFDPFGRGSIICDPAGDDAIQLRGQLFHHSCQHTLGLEIDPTLKGEAAEAMALVRRGCAMERELNDVAAH
jgi:hypothetical protein